MAVVRRVVARLSDGGRRPQHPLASRGAIRYAGAMRHATLLLLAALVTVPARAANAPGAFAPYEDLVQVLADLTWHLKDDVYRYPPPRDPTGHDLYRLSLERLKSWEQRFPSRMRDVTSFGRAQALERVREYAAAADAYRQVAAMPASPLAARAKEGADRATAFATAAAMPETGRDLAARVTTLRAKLDAWGKLIERWTGTPYESIALVEEERVETIAAEAVVDHQDELDEGPATAERSLRFLVQKHADSKNLPSHILRLADLYAQLTRQYVAAHDRPLAFDAEAFTSRADQALEMYRKVATWDGVPEKLEGQGRFAAFDAYKSSTLARFE